MNQDKNYLSSNNMHAEKVSMVQTVRAAKGGMVQAKGSVKTIYRASSRPMGQWSEPVASGSIQAFFTAFFSSAETKK